MTEIPATKPWYPTFKVQKFPRRGETDAQWACVLRDHRRHAEAKGIYLGLFQLLAAHWGFVAQMPAARLPPAEKMRRPPRRGRLVVSLPPVHPALRAAGGRDRREDAHRNQRRGEAPPGHARRPRRAEPVDCGGWPVFIVGAYGLRAVLANERPDALE